MTLPRLLYVADVPVEASYHGSALVHRLLRRYPRDRLRIVEGNLQASLARRRLEGVEYRVLEVGDRRWLDTRLHRAASSWYARCAARRAPAIAPLAEGFDPEAVLTVVHGFAWIAAARFAAARALPLHLIVHDDWPTQARLFAPVRAWLDAEVGRVYRQAASRLCVSPNMEAAYRQRYGAPGAVLLPSRAPDAPRFDLAPAVPDRALAVGFGGTINSPGYAHALRRVAAALAPIGGTLDLFGPADATQAARMGLDRPNVRLRGLVAADEFIPRMRAEVDVLLLAMSFDPADRENMRLCFPSKLADYTAAGLAILAFGPADSSGVAWAREHEGAAEVVDRDDAQALDGALRRLASRPHREQIARRALVAGEESFAHARAEAILNRHLGGGP